VRLCVPILPPVKGPDIDRTATHAGWLNPFPGLRSWFHPFTYKRFHVLLNSLFKVLCNFPSRYLFAIGHTGVFSLTSSLRGALGCTLKQPDSSTPGLASVGRYRYGPTTHSGQGSLSEELAEHTVRKASTQAFTQHLPHTAKGGGTLRWALPFSLAVTRGIPFGFFSSAE
jgi:hypothetical protein